MSTLRLRVHFFCLCAKKRRKVIFILLPLSYFYNSIIVPSKYLTEIFPVPYITMHSSVTCICSASNVCTSLSAYSRRFYARYAIKGFFPFCNCGHFFTHTSLFSISAFHDFIKICSSVLSSICILAHPITSFSLYLALHCQTLLYLLGVVSISFFQMFHHIPRK